MTFQTQIITLVPELWPTLLSAASGLVGRAFEEERLKLNVIDLREFGKGVHRQVDDTPYGGGPGMILKIEPLSQAIEKARSICIKAPVVLLSPRGEKFTQASAARWAQGAGVTFICGRYEGVDERVHRYVDESVSIGDFVLSAGDPAAWCMIDALARLRAGVLGNAESLSEESFGEFEQEYPQYTRPVEFKGVEVPEVLRSGDHAKIAAWRREHSKK
jgi:tRNA (guanine37-N1)-methyltransferase